MERIGVRELRQYASRYLERVKAGESIEVTERGKLIALLVAPSPAQSARARLVEAGSLVPALQPFSLPHRVTLAGSSSTASEALQDLRDDRS
jgi:prevent-host-death family protein